jgi:hypothetical protein
MYRSRLVAAVVGWSCLWLTVLVAKARGQDQYVPGKVFDRFITIWLENQVRIERATYQECGGDGICCD